MAHLVVLRASCVAIYSEIFSAVSSIGILFLIKGWVNFWLPFPDADTARRDISGVYTFFWVDVLKWCAERKAKGSFKPTADTIRLRSVYNTKF